MKTGLFKKNSFNRLTLATGCCCVNEVAIWFSLLMRRHSHSIVNPMRRSCKISHLYFNIYIYILLHKIAEIDFIKVFF